MILSTYEELQFDNFCPRLCRWTASYPIVVRTRDFQRHKWNEITIKSSDLPISIRKPIQFTGTEGDEAIVRNRPTVSRCDASEPRFDNLFNRVYVLRHVHALFTVRFTFPDSASDDFARESRTPRRTVVSGIRDTRSIEKRTRPIGIDIDHRHRHRHRHRRRHRRFSSNKGGKSASNHSKPREEHNETVRETTIPFMFDLARLAVYGGNRCTLGDEPSGFPDGFFYNQLSLDRAYRWLCCSWDTFSDRYWQDNGVLCGAVIKTRGRAERGRTRGGSGCSFLFARASQGIMREKERKRERRTWWTRQRRERQLQEQRER